jgi:hypothetical protein
MFGLRRREFITLFRGAAAAWPFGARAQQDTPVVGVLRINPKGSDIFAEPFGRADAIWTFNSLYSRPKTPHKSPARSHAEAACAKPWLLACGLSGLPKWPPRPPTRGGPKIGGAAPASQIRRESRVSAPTRRLSSQ